MMAFSYEEIDKAFRYDPETGEIFWKFTSTHHRGLARIGERAEYIAGNGYYYVRLKGTPLLAHRVAWLLFHKTWPLLHLDHANKIPLDNRISNLRECTRSQNQQNRGPASNNKSGLKGVSFQPKQRGNKKWRAVINVAGKQKHLGNFYTADEAHHAYSSAAKKFFGEFARAS